MYKKFNQLSFIIGLFFFIESIILFTNALLNQSGFTLTVYTAITFFIFGLAMMLVKNKNADENI